MLPDKSAIATIKDSRAYNKLAVGTHRLSVTTLQKAKVLREDQYTLEIRSDPLALELNSAAVGQMPEFASVIVETTLGHQFSSTLRKGVHNQIVLKTLD